MKRGRIFESVTHRENIVAHKSKKDVKAGDKRSPAKEKEQWKSCNPLLARDKETLLACGKLKRGYLYKAEAQINSYEFNISASDD